MLHEDAASMDRMLLRCALLCTISMQKAAGRAPRMWRAMAWHASSGRSGSCPRCCGATGGASMLVGLDLFAFLQSIAQ